jgi:phage recombination protein Bet
MTNEPKKVRTIKPTVVTEEVAVPVITKKDEGEIKNLAVVMENKELAPQDTFGKMTRAQIDLIKRTIARGASDDELKVFIQVCKGAQLNPFLKQVFLVPRWDSNEGREIRAIQVSIDGFRSIAESSGAYAGNDDPRFEGETEIEIPQKTGAPKKLTIPNQATVTVYKIVDRQRYEFTATARWSEYYPGPKNGFQWHIRPYLMLGKCAEALALRKAFPKLLSGMYEEAELANQAEPQMKIKATTEKKTESREELISKASFDELEKYRDLIAKATTDKYSEEEKKKLLAMVDARMKELSK